MARALTPDTSSSFRKSTWNTTNHTDQSTSGGTRRAKGSFRKSLRRRAKVRTPNAERPGNGDIFNAIWKLTDKMLWMPKDSSGRNEPDPALLSHLLPYAQSAVVSEPRHGVLRSRRTPDLKKRLKPRKIARFPLVPKELTNSASKP